MTNNIHNKQSIFDCFLTKLKNKENKNNNEKRQKHLRTFFLYWNIAKKTGRKDNSVF